MFRTSVQDYLLVLRDREGRFLPEVYQRQARFPEMTTIKTKRKISSHHSDVVVLPKNLRCKNSIHKDLSTKYELSVKVWAEDDLDALFARMKVRPR
jgi:hypothetical protein